MPSGATATMPADVLLDTAVLYFDYQTSPTKLGASRGGLRFEPRRTLRQIEYDGRRSVKIGEDRIVEYGAAITGTLIEIAPNLLTALEPGGTPVYTAGPPGEREYTPADASAMFAVGNYLDDVALVWQRGNGGTFEVRFAHAIVTEYNISGEDANEAGAEITIEARRAVGTADDDPPYTLVVTGPDITS